MSTTPNETAAAPAKPIEHPCLQCGREERTDLTGILGPKCQAKVAKTWGSRPDRKNHAALREDRLGRLYEDHLRGKRGPLRVGPNGGVR